MIKVQHCPLTFICMHSHVCTYTRTPTHTCPPTHVCTNKHTCANNTHRLEKEKQHRWEHSKIVAEASVRHYGTWNTSYLSENDGQDTYQVCCTKSILHALNPRSRLGCLRARCVPGTLNSETRIHTEALTCTTGNM